MRQYFELKAKHRDALLLFRVGDFYETFGEDAIKASSSLGIVLTSRNNGGSDVELAGFPHHSLDLYLPRLVKSGYRVAICEQLEKPSKEKKIVKRGITDVITPGIGTDDHLLKQKENNFLGAIHVGSTGEVGCSFLDLSTGEFMLYQGDKLSVQKLLSTYNPKEVIFGNSQKSHIDNLLGDSYYSYSLDDWIFQYDYAYGKLIDLFEVKNLKGFAVNGCKYGQISAGAILHYLELTEQRQLGHINKIARINLDQFVWLDQFTIRNLELIHATHPSGIPLVDVIDQTTTPMGGRLLRKWLLLPLTDKNLIEERLNAVELLFTKQGLSEDLDDHLKVISDLERIVAKVALHKVNPRELYNLKISLERIPLIVSLFKDHTENGLDPILKSMSHLPDIVQKLDLSLNPHPPINTSKGGVIKDGYNAELDKLRDLIANSKSHLEKLLQSEIIKTKITNLKVGFNNVFGYYFEVTNRYKDQNLIPDLGEDADQCRLSQNG